MYRTNVNLTDELGARLVSYSEKTGIPRAGIIAMAVDQYLNEQEFKQKVLEELKDPEKMGVLIKSLGLEMPQN